MDFTPDPEQQAVADVVTSVLARDNSWDALVADIGQFIEMAKAARPGLPVVLFGHSMGSAAAQQFAPEGSNAIDALVLSGSSSRMGRREGESPTAFTPNGDGANDVFLVRGGPFAEFQFQLYDNWGVQIFSSDQQSIGWDGTYRDKEQPGGVYIYTFKGRTIDGKDVDMAGDISIIR